MQAQSAMQNAGTGRNAKCRHRAQCKMQDRAQCKMQAQGAMQNAGTGRNAK